MSFFKKILKSSEKTSFDTKKTINIVDDEERRRRDDFGRDGTRYGGDDAARRLDGIQLVYFSQGALNDRLIENLKELNKDIQTYTDEKDCIDYITTVTIKVFLIIEGTATETFIEAIDKLKQIDSVFVYSPSEDATREFSKKQHTFLVIWCDDRIRLIEKMQQSSIDLVQQNSAFSIYNKKEKATRDLSKEAGSFLFFQLIKTVIKNLPKTEESKKTMITTCRQYYRGNAVELANIDEFDRTYRADEAIPWYTKETFVYKFINKALRTEDIDVLYQFRFYIMDLSDQLELKFRQLKEKQKGILRLYRGLKLSHDEVNHFQNSIDQLISTNGYLSTSSEFSVAYGFATKSAKREGVVRALFEYEVDLNSVTKIVIADIREYSAFPEEAEVLVDIGASFQIKSCEYNSSEDLWRVRVQATDQGADLAAEFMDYQKKKMAESNDALMLGNLLLEMGEYNKAERYFDTILSSSNPNDEEIACIFFNFGRAHRLKGDFTRAIACYNRALNLHINARPKREASAGKTLNGLGVVFSEQGRLLQAEECFQRALKLYQKSIPKKHVDVAGLLINLGTIDSDRQDYERAAEKYTKAKKIYDRSLPPEHPNRALPRVNLGNVFFAAGQYDLSLIEYKEGLELQEKSLPPDHPDIARTLHNIAVAYAHQGDLLRAKEYLERAQETASRMLSSKHPVMNLLEKTKHFLVDEEKDLVYSRH